MSYNSIVTHLTTAQLQGTGVLDTLLTTLQLHLDQQFNKGVMSTKEASEAFIQLYQVNLQTALSFLFQDAMLQPQIDKIRSDIALACKQEAIADANKELLLQQVQNAVNQTELTRLQQLQLATQTRNAEAEGLLLSAQLEKTKKEANVVDEQALLLHHQKEKASIDTKIAKFELSTKLPKEMQLLDAQIAKMAADTALANRQLDLLDKELDLKDKEIALKAKELELSQVQIDLYKQKIITEKAQVDPSVVLPGSSIDHNNKLLAAQTAAYKDDQVIKATKLILDSYITSVGNGDGNANTLNLQDDATLGKFMERLGDTINVPLTAVPITPTTP